MLEKLQQVLKERIELAKYMLQKTFLKESVMPIRIYDK